MSWARSEFINKVLAEDQEWVRVFSCCSFSPLSYFSSFGRSARSHTVTIISIAVQDQVKQVAINPTPTLKHNGYSKSDSPAAR